MSASLNDLIDVERYENWQKSIIYEKTRYRDQDSDEAVAARRSVAVLQEQLHAAVDGGREATRAYLFGVLGVEDHERAVREVPKMPNPLTVGEMSSLPLHAECELAECLRDSLTTAQAAQPALWTLCHAVWIGLDMFGWNLAAIFLEGSKASTPEARTRNFLRRTGGLRRVRGNVSPLTDCPISVAWWRSRIAADVSKVAEIEGEELAVRAAHEVLHHNEVWSNLVRMSLRRVTAVSAPRARAAAVVALGRYGLEHDGLALPQKVVRARVQSTIISLARLSYGHNIEFAPWLQIVETAVEGIRSVDADEVIDASDEPGDVE